MNERNVFYAVFFYVTQQSHERLNERNSVWIHTLLSFLGSLLLLFSSSSNNTDNHLFGSIVLCFAKSWPWEHLNDGTLRTFSVLFFIVITLFQPPSNSWFLLFDDREDLLIFPFIILHVFVDSFRWSEEETEEKAPPIFVALMFVVMFIKMLIKRILLSYFLSSFFLLYLSLSSFSLFSPTLSLLTLLIFIHWKENKTNKCKNKTWRGSLKIWDQWWRTWRETKKSEKRKKDVKNKPVWLISVKISREWEEEGPKVRVVFMTFTSFAPFLHLNWLNMRFFQDFVCCYCWSSSI